MVGIWSGKSVVWRRISESFVVKIKVWCGSLSVNLSSLANIWSVVALLSLWANSSSDVTSLVSVVFPSTSLLTLERTKLKNKTHLHHFRICSYVWIFFVHLHTLIWTASSEFGTYRLSEQRRFRRACASAQSRQNLRCSLIQAVNQEEPLDRKPDPWPL